MHLATGPVTGDQREAGFTLIELLVVIVILGVIVVPLGNAVIGYFLNAAATTARIGESHDEQIAAAYWQQDVASVGNRATTYNQATQTFDFRQSVNAAFPCAVPAGSSNVVVLAWSEYDQSANPTSISVAYVLDSTKTQLTRLHCRVTTIDSAAVLAHYLDAATPPVLTCNGAGGSSCTGSGTNVPTFISLQLRIKDPSGSGQPYTVTLTGQRRQT
jgi:prepilin-type N-terminal cleavage/methylation domain-containing protein